MLKMRVISRSSAFTFKGEKVNIPEAAKKLNVAHILEGSVRKAGNQVRITVQLIEARSDTHLWSETYDRELKNVFAIQDEIALAVVDALKITLLGNESKATETNPEAYALYLQGKYFFNLYSEDNYQKAVTSYQAALAIDPDYAPAFAGLSEVYLLQTGVHINTIEGMALTRSMAERALSLDPGLAEAWVALAKIRWVFDWDWEGAEAAINRALELESGNAAVLYWSARIKFGFGYMDEAIALQRQVLSLDPLNLEMIRFFGIFLRTAGQMQESEATFKHLLMLNPQVTIGHTDFAKMLLLKGDPEAALREAEQEPSAFWRTYAMSLAYYATGQNDKADETLAAFIRDYKIDAVYQIAQIYAFRGEVDLAFEWLESAYAQHDGALTHIVNDRLFASLHDDHRWETILEKMNLLDYWHAKKARQSAASS